MSPMEIIDQARAEGIALTLTQMSTLKVAGDQLAVERWLPILRENKPAIIEALAQTILVPEGAISIQDEESDLKPGWKKSIATWPGDFQECWREIVELRCQAGELRPLAEALAYCDVEEALEAWPKYH